MCNASGSAISTVPGIGVVFFREKQQNGWKNSGLAGNWFLWFGGLKLGNFSPFPCVEMERC